MQDGGPNRSNHKENDRGVPSAVVSGFRRLVRG